MEDDAQGRHDKLVGLLTQILDKLDRIAETMVTVADLYEPPEPDCYD